MALVAAIGFVFPRWGVGLAWSRAVLVGWDVQHVPQHTTALTGVLACLVTVHLCILGHARLAVGLLVQHALGVMPNELLNLTNGDIVLLVLVVLLLDCDYAAAQQQHVHTQLFCGMQF